MGLLQHNREKQLGAGPATVAQDREGNRIIKVPPLISPPLLSTVENQLKLKQTKIDGNLFHNRLVRWVTNFVQEKNKIS